MDPEQTRKDMTNLIKAEMWDDAAQCAGSLIRWLELGGMSPFPYSRTAALAYLKSIVSRAARLKSLGAD